MKRSIFGVVITCSVTALGACATPAASGPGKATPPAAAQPPSAGHSGVAETKPAPRLLPSARVKADAEEFNAPVTGGLVGDVVKGDELTLSDGTQIRLIGVKTPIAAVSQRNGNYYGKGALELTRKLMEWKRVRLETDVQVHDVRGRILAYAYTADGKFLQEELLRNGLALAEAFPPNIKHRGEFMIWQREAVNAKKGLWGLKPGDYQRVNNVENYRIEGVHAKRVINGDSLELEDGTVVRYIGIDSPDSENRAVAGEVGNASYVANRKWVDGKELTIEYDVETKDPTGRDLAYIFSGNQMINAALVREGHAVVAVFPNVKYLDALLKAQDEAARDKRGLWSGGEQ